MTLLATLWPVAAFLALVLAVMGIAAARQRPSSATRRALVPLALLRTAADLVCMGASWVIAPLRKRRERRRAEHLAWVARARFAQQQQRHAREQHEDFCGCGIRPADWLMFCGALRGLYREVRETERRRHL